MSLPNFWFYRSLNNGQNDQSFSWCFSRKWNTIFNTCFWWNAPSFSVYYRIMTNFHITEYSNARIGSGYRSIKSTGNTKTWYSQESNKSTANYSGASRDINGQYLACQKSSCKSLLKCSHVYKKWKHFYWQHPIHFNLFWNEYSTCRCFTSPVYFALTTVSIPLWFSCLLKCDPDILIYYTVYWCNCVKSALNELLYGLSYILTTIVLSNQF